MYYKVNAIVLILSGKCCGFGFFSMDIPKNIKLNESAKKLINHDTVTLEVKRVETVQKEKVVRIFCSIREIKNCEMEIDYAVSDDDYFAIENAFPTSDSLADAPDANAAVLAVKKIVDSYDPFLQLGDMEWKNKV